MMTLTLLLAEITTETIDAAASKSDRWLFIATLIILGSFAMMMMKHFMRQTEKLIADHSVARNTYQDALRSMSDKANETAADLAAVVALNTNASERTGQVLAQCVKIIDECTTELREARKDREKGR